MHLYSDLGIATLCLGSSAYLYLLHHRRTHTFSPTQPCIPSSGYVLTNQVTHSRLLPAETKHAFTYATLSLLLSLSALENQSLNQGWRGLVFGYPGLWRLCGLRSETYLDGNSYSTVSRTPKIQEKLAGLLRSSNIRLGEVWIMTMPSFLGFEGINPLTVYFCYEEGKDNVWGVVLEVHNTFGERHAYILQVGQNEDMGEKKMKGYEHQWTFPRQFHVSPFNDRSGHYVCSVVMPSHPPPLPTSSNTAQVPAPRPIINLHLLTEPPASQLKLTALLRPVLSEPLSAQNLLAALVFPPFISSRQASQGSLPKPAPASWSSLPLGAALFLTAFRIVYHAGRLHYQRGLAVFARPEPTAGAGREWVQSALGGVWNDVQPSEIGKNVGGSIGWKRESSSERWARERFEAQFGKAAEQLGVCVRIASVDPNVPLVNLGHFDAAKHTQELTLCYRSPRTWTGLLLAPTAAHALELGSRAERWFAVSNEQLFFDLWSKASASTSQSSAIIDAVRTRLAKDPSPTSTSPVLPHPPYPSHPFDSQGSFSEIFHVCLLYLTFHLERTVFGLVRARFVQGDTPWRVWDRVGRQTRVGAGGVGSAIK